MEAEVLLAKGQRMDTTAMESQHLALAGQLCSKAFHQAQLSCWVHLLRSCADTSGSSHFGHFTAASPEEVLMVLTSSTWVLHPHTHPWHRGSI